MIVTSRGHTEDHLARIQEFAKRIEDEHQRNLFFAYFTGAICASAGGNELRGAIDIAIQANQIFAEPSAPLSVLIDEAHAAQATA